MLDKDDYELLSRLLEPFLAFLDQQLQVLPKRGKRKYDNLSSENKRKLREAWAQNVDVVESYVTGPLAKNLSPEDVSVIRSWRHLVAGEFYVSSQLRDQTVFLSTADPPTAYYVWPSCRKSNQMVWPPSAVVETLLLPLNSMIVLDYRLGADTKPIPAEKMVALKRRYGEARGRHGIVESLPVPEGRKLEPCALFEGRWLIKTMENWNERIARWGHTSYIEFEPNGQGRFEFGGVDGTIDYRCSTRASKPAVEWSWAGKIRFAETSGRGWAVIDDDRLCGELFFYQRDECKFEATR